MTAFQQASLPKGDTSNINWMQGQGPYLDQNKITNHWQRMPAYKLKKKLANKIFGYLRRCKFLAKIVVVILDLVGSVDFLAKFGAKSDFRVWR